MTTIIRNMSRLSRPRYSERKTRGITLVANQYDYRGKCEAIASPVDARIIWNPRNYKSLICRDD